MIVKKSRPVYWQNESRSQITCTFLIEAARICVGQSARRLVTVQNSVEFPPIRVKHRRIKSRKRNAESTNGAAFTP